MGFRASLTGPTIRPTPVPKRKNWRYKTAHSLRIPAIGSPNFGRPLVRNCVKRFNQVVSGFVGPVNMEGPTPP